MKKIPIIMLALSVIMLLTMPAWAEPTLTAAQQKKLATLMATYGLDSALSQRVTAALGLSKGDEVLTLRQLTSKADPNLHSYIPLPDGGVLLIFVDSTAAWDYRLDTNLKLVAAVSAVSGRPLVVIPISDAERNVQVELEYWAAVADRH